METQDTLTLDLLKDLAIKILPKDSKVWLYGSRARGDFHEFSDWDLLILLNKQKIEIDDFPKYGYPFVELGSIHFADVSPQLYSFSDWSNLERLQTPYYKNIQEDKRIVYGTI